MGERALEDDPIRFGAFELNVRAGELRKGGVRLKLAEQPFRILHYLVSRPGEIVTREELQKLLWGDDTFVDFDRGLNAAINRLREALGDSAATPRYVETVPRRGYRFIGGIWQAPVAVAETAPVIEKEQGGAWRRWAAVAVIVVLAVAGGVWIGRRGAATVVPQLTLRPLTADSGLTVTPVISRDGKLVAYASDRATSKNLDIWVHPLVTGAQPIRLTKDDADELTPDFSPDGGTVVYRSERDGGGIYLVPALGGAERLLVRGGRFPRFSPDGKWIAYTVGGANELVPGKIYQIPAAGGEPQQMALNLPWALAPFYSPDGQRLFFHGAEGMGSNAPHDVWVVPAQGGPAVATGVYGILADQLRVPRHTIGWFPAEVVDRKLLFVWTGQIWELDLTGPEWTATGPARPLTSRGTFWSVRAGGGRVVMASGQFASHLWRLRMDLNRGKVLGDMEPLPHAGGSQIFPSASSDGGVFAYLQGNPDGETVRLANRKTGKETLLLNAFARPKVSPDGSRVAFSPRSADSVQMVASEGGPATTLFQAEGKLTMQVRSWTVDGKKILYWTGEPFRWFLMDVATRVSSEFISHPKLVVYTVELSPDEHWVAFATQAGSEWNLWIAPVRDGKAAGEAEWILVNRGADERPWWSPDGNLLYTMSKRDGPRCIWAQRLDPATKRPRGEPFPVHHIHGARLTVGREGLLAEFGPAVTPEGLIFSLHEYSGNVWVGER